jgi:hypothetical protein
VDFFRAVVSPTTKSDSAVRRKLGLANVSPTEVAADTTAASCTAAAVAVNAVITTKRANYPLHVIALGRLYGVAFAPESGPGRNFAYVFDESWHLVRIVTTF